MSDEALIKLIKLIKEIHAENRGSSASFPDIVNPEEFDLHGFEKQRSDYDGVEFEYVYQRGCADYGFHGQVAIPFESRLLVFSFWD